MATFIVTGPDGKKYRVSGQGTKDDALAEVQRRVNAGASAQQSAQPPAAQSTSMMETASDIGKSFGSGLARGAAYIAGLPGDLNEMVGRGIGAARDYFVGDVTPEQRAKIDDFRRSGQILPTTDDIMSAAHNVTGMSLHQPQTTAGKYARTVGEFSPAALTPGGAVARTARVVLPGMVSEAAGQATEGTPLEPYARVGGALAGGMAAPGRASTKIAAKGAPTARQLKKTTDQLYDQLRGAGIRYDPQAFSGAVVRTESHLLKKGLRPSVAKEAFAYLDDLKAQSGGIDFSDLDGIIQVAGTAQRAATRAGNYTLAKAFEMIRDDLSSFETMGKLIIPPGLPRAQYNSLIREARRTALRNIKQRELSVIMANADTYQSGIEAGIRNGISNLLRSKRGRQLFKGAEREALLAVAKGRKALQTLSRFGFDLTSWSGNATFLPTLGTVGAGLYDPLAGAGLAAAGTAAKFVSPRMTKSALDQASGAIRSGSLVGAPRLPPSFTSLPSAGVSGLLEMQRQNLPK